MLVLKLNAARERKRARTGKCEGRKGYADTEEGRAIIREVKRLRRKKPGCKAMTYKQIAERMRSNGMSSIAGRPVTENIVKHISLGT